LNGSSVSAKAFGSVLLEFLKRGDAHYNTCMPTREELHKLIDSMPDGAIEAAHRMLNHMQVWPPPAPPGADEMRQRMKERRTQVMQRQKPGTFAAFGGGGNYDAAKGVASSSFSHWEDDWYVTEVLRRHHGHELSIVERVRVDGHHLIYRNEVSGPGDKRDEREVVFDVC
jgi:hypothetical protein